MQYIAPLPTKCADLEETESTFRSSAFFSASARAWFSLASCWTIKIFIKKGFLNCQWIQCMYKCKRFVVVWMHCSLLLIANTTITRQWMEAWFRFLYKGTMIGQGYWDSKRLIEKMIFKNLKSENFVWNCLKAVLFKASKL